jgi:glucokinase
MPHHVTLACDLGGTRVKLGAFSDGNLLRDLVLPSRAGESGRILELGRRLRELAAELSLGRVDGLGIGIPAIVDSSAKRVLDRHGKFDDLLDFDFDAWSRREFGCPVAIDNDARVAMLGEWRRGAGRGARSLVYIGLGTGIGTGVVMDGRPLRGEHYQAGIMGGHLCLKPGGRACGCGSAGCYEAETSLPAAMELARGSSHFGSSPLARAANPDFALLFEADAAGDPCAREVVETCVRN